MQGGPLRQSRLIVIGGSSASGHGIGRGCSYGSMTAEQLGFVPNETIREGIRMPHMREFVAVAEPRSGDVLVLHPGLFDTKGLMPRRWYSAVKAAQRGRGRLDAWEVDRRLSSRLNRRLAREVETGLMRVARLTGRVRSSTPLGEFEECVVAIEESLSTFSGLVLCVVPDRFSLIFDSAVPDLEPYRRTILALLVDRRQGRGLPVAAIDLARELDDGDYQPDNFHPNESGHAKLASRCTQVIQENPT